MTFGDQRLCGDIFTPLLISNARTMCTGSFVTANKLVTKSAAASDAVLWLVDSLFSCHTKSNFCVDTNEALALQCYIISNLPPFCCNTQTDDGGTD